MTYCIGVQLDSGLIFLSDSRTSAGVDQVNIFRKVNTFVREGDRVLVLLSAGNLAITQALVSVLQERMSTQGAVSLLTVQNGFEAARHVGDCLREIYHHDAKALRDFAIDFNASFILGGQIGQEVPRLFNIYAAGNFIEASRETPYFQIGEAKYGKPIIDRVVHPGISLEDAAKCALISMDSTIRSNLSVGLPLDLIVVKRDSLCVDQHVVIDQEDIYFRKLSQRWGESLRQAFLNLPDPAWKDQGLSLVQQQMSQQQ